MFLMHKFFFEAVHNLTVVNVTSTSFEIGWIIPSQCPDSTQKAVQVNGEIQPLKYTIRFESIS